MNRRLWIALACGILPLVAGLGTFAAWFVTRADALMMVGMVVLGVGVVLFLVGVAALVRYVRAGRSGEDPARPPNLTAVLALGGLLFLNFPVAGVLVAAVIRIETMYTVVVENRTGRDLTDVRVTGGGCIEVLGAIAAGESGRRIFWIRTDGRLVLTARDGDRKLEQVIEDYVTPNQGGRVKVTLHPDGAMVLVNYGAPEPDA